MLKRRNFDREQGQKSGVELFSKLDRNEKKTGEVRLTLLSTIRRLIPEWENLIFVECGDLARHVGLKVCKVPILCRQVDGMFKVPDCSVLFSKMPACRLADAPQNVQRFGTGLMHHQERGAV